MQYYRQAGPIAEVPAPTIQSEQQAKIQAVIHAVQFTVGQVLEAKVLAVKGNKVTYEILEAIKLTEKEPKKAATFNEEQMVRVEVVDLKEDGSLKKVKAVD